MSDYPELDELALKQHGLVTLSQCESHQLRDRQVHWFRQTGVMIGVRRGVYRWCGARQGWEMMAMAAVLAAGAGAVLSHRSAGRLWALLPAQGGRLELTASRQIKLDGALCHRHALTPAECTTRDGIPVTTAARTLLDLAESCGAEELGRLIDEARRRRLTTVRELEATLRGHAGGGRRRKTVLRHALSERGAGYDPGANDWERRMQEAYDRLGLPPAVRQFPVRTKGRRYVLDRAIVELRIGIEFNGRRYHGSRSGFDYDSRRRNDLMQAGWLVIDFTTNTREARMKATVEAAVEERRRLLLLPA